MKVKFTLLTALIIITISVWPFTKPEESTRLLEDQGYTDVQIKGHGWFSCQKGDIFSTKFTALNLQNRQVKGVVCRGIFKNNTIRWG